MTDEREEWRACSALPNVEASNFGRVRRISDGYLYVEETDKDGYKRVSVRRKHYLVHRLVYMAWRGPLVAGLVVCHMDGTRANNRPDNLEQLTQRENIAHKTAHGTAQLGEKHGNCKFNDDQVLELLRGYSRLPRYPRTGKVYHGALANFAAEKGISETTIFTLLKRRSSNV